MTTNSLKHKFNKKQLWYLATVCGFGIGWVLGWKVLDFFPSSKWLQIIFWAYPVGGAGLGMSLSQWGLIRKTYKYAYLWIPITTIGFIASIGGTLLLIYAIPAFFEGSFYSTFEHWVSSLTAVAPIIILLGPFCQWFIIRDIADGQPYKEILKISVGWIAATFLLIIMFYILLFITDSFSSIGLFFISVGIAIPSGLVFAQATKTAVRTI